MSDITEMGQLYLSVGDQTEDLVAFITDGLDDEMLDEIEVGRILDREDLASEPFTVGVVLFLGGAAIYSVAKLINVYLENERQKEWRRDLITGWTKDPELAIVMAEVEKTHSDVVVNQGPIDFHDLDSSSWAGPSLSQLSTVSPSS